MYFTTGSVSYQTSGNPNTTGNALFDTLLGNYYQYTETDKEKWTPIRMTQIEGYVADTWKVLSNLTLDIGVRYQFLPPPYTTDNGISTFMPNLFNPANAQQVIPTGTNAGQLQPGVGQPANGIVHAGTGGLSRGFYDNQNKFSPRFGFAWDPSRNGTFSVRGGAAPHERGRFELRRRQSSVRKHRHSV